MYPAGGRIACKPCPGRCTRRHLHAPDVGLNSDHHVLVRKVLCYCSLDLDVKLVLIVNPPA